MKFKEGDVIHCQNLDMCGIIEKYFKYRTMDLVHVRWSKDLKSVERVDELVLAPSLHQILYS